MKQLLLTNYIILLFLVVNIISDEQYPCPLTETIDINISTTQVLSNKSIITKNGDRYNERQYFRYNSTIKGCVCMLRTCIRKCCPIGYHYKRETCHLKNKNDPFEPKFYYGSNETEFKNYAVLEENLCEHGLFVLNKSVEEHYLQTNGSILHENILYTINDYCLDEFAAIDNETINTGICFGPPDDIPVGYPLGMLISVPFLLATFLVYALIPELQNLHGKSLMCHVTSLSFAYIFLATVQLNLALPEEICHISAFCIQFFFLVSFLWLNVMCFDIWWTFSGFRGFRGSMREAEHKKFLIYCVYAWGVPLVISIITVITQYHPAIKDHPLSPKIGANKCFFDSEKAVILYFYGPVAAIIICNLILFIITAIKIIRIKRETAVLQRGDSRRHDHYENDKQRFNLYLKLFIVMGVNWVAEVLSFFAQGPDWMWIVTDLFNTLQGVLIFIIFVCKRHIWKLLKKRYYSVTDRPYFTQTSTIRTQDSNVSTSNDVQMRKISRNNDS